VSKKAKIFGEIKFFLAKEGVIFSLRLDKREGAHWKSIEGNFIYVSYKEDFRNGCI
jgi:hypothetical protein